MPETFRTQRRVEFRDTDAAGIMHFSRYFTLMEEVEHEFLRSLGWSVVQPQTDGTTISWPRVSANCDYERPSRFEDVLDVELQVQRIGTKSVSYGFTFQDESRNLATGSLTAVCCRIEHGSPPTAIPIPQDLRQQFERFCPSNGGD